MKTASRTNAANIRRPVALFAASTLRAAAILGVCVGATVSAPTALAAVATVAPYSVAPAKGDLKVRSGAGGVWYAVATVKAGTALRVDGESDGWLRVAYLPGMAAVVKASDAEKRADGTVALTRPSALSGLDMADPSIEACYKAVLDEKLPVGTTLRYLGDVTDRSGKVEGYRVEAPAGARGWVSAAETKKLTEAEVAKMGGAPAVNQGAAPKVAAPAPAPAPTSTPAPQPVATQPAPTQPTATPTTPAGTPAAGNPAGTPPVPVTTPAPEGTTPPTLTTGEPQPGTAATPEPAVVEPPKPREPTPEELRAREIAAKMKARNARLAGLDDAYRVVTAQPVEVAEIEPLISEYEKFKADYGSDPSAARQIVNVNNRIELLRLRTGLQEKYQKMAELKSRADQTMANISSGIQQIQNSRMYLVVGRLTTSAMYDGTRLPMLYRVQSVDTNAARTLAYLTPEPGQQLEMKLGMIVGVKGDGPFDPSAKVNVLIPSQVDILKNADGTPIAVPAATPQ
jgi:hypothetical protein